jgi:hypothetical protein
MMKAVAGLLSHKRCTVFDTVPCPSLPSRGIDHVQLASTHKVGAFSLPQAAQRCLCLLSLLKTRSLRRSKDHSLINDQLSRSSSHTVGEARERYGATRLLRGSNITVGAR